MLWEKVRVCKGIGLPNFRSLIVLSIEPTASLVGTEHRAEGEGGGKCSQCGQLEQVSLPGHIVPIQHAILSTRHCHIPNQQQVVDGSVVKVVQRLSSHCATVAGYCLLMVNEHNSLMNKPTTPQAAPLAQTVMIVLLVMKGRMTVVMKAVVVHW
ncbi:hypothetical protein E2C01_016640 [Portunus trituberculatus]|uniref:Uncharacterized protein n=1 Tax=Portunus trituberculatus TaxID=210409 RepID=A0A5B7DRH3_PORTR|nr:hypothetical protein [Portunus trituberculatus]